MVQQTIVLVRLLLCSVKRWSAYREAKRVHQKPGCANKLIGDSTFVPSPEAPAPCRCALAWGHPRITLYLGMTLRRVKFPEQQPYRHSCGNQRQRRPRVSLLVRPVHHVTIGGAQVCDLFAKHLETRLHPLFMQRAGLGELSRLD